MVVGYKTLPHFLLDTARNGSPNPSGYIWPNASDLIELRDQSRRGRVDVLASVPRLWFVEMLREKQSYLDDIDPAEHLRRSLDHYLKPLAAWYDAIIFDCPPGFSSLTRAGLLSVEAVISPTIADAVSVRSLSDFVEIGLTDVLKIKGRVKHYVVISKYRANTVHGREADLLKKRFEVLEPYVKDSVDMTRATERIRADSFRGYDAKFGSLRGDLRKLTDTVYRYVIRLRGTQ